MKKITILGVLSIAALLTVACDFTPTTSSDKATAKKQEVMQRQAEAEAGLPAISSFTEKKDLKRLYEMRDQAVLTYTYVPDMNGKLWHLCDSKGFGIPYAAQYSNPQKRIFRTDTNATHEDYDSPQAEPNGLFMPSSAEGTWVICTSPKGQFTPIYVEPRIIVSTIKLHSAGEYAEQ